MHFRKATEDDLDQIKALYESVARGGEGIARKPHEVTTAYVKKFIESSLDSGLIVVAEHPDDPQQLVAEIHASKYGIEIFGHVLGNLTIAVHPEFQGRKVGKGIFSYFLDEVIRHHPDILRVELMARDSNIKAIRLYESLGFKVEGRMEGRIRREGGGFGDDIPMGWRRT